MHAHTPRLVLAVVASATVAYVHPAVGQAPSACTPLSSGVPVANLAAGSNAQLCFTLVVPAGQSALVVETAGGTGNADLYARFEAMPTLRAYACRGTSKTSSDSCAVADPAAGTWYVMVNARSAFAGVTLSATHSGPTCTRLQNGVALTNLSAARGDRPCFVIEVPTGHTSLAVTTGGGDGNEDLYVRFGWAPTLRSYDCRSMGKTNTATCTIDGPAAGDWFVMLNAATAFSGVRLTATYDHTRLLLVSGGDQLGSINTPLPAPIVVRLEDGAGAPIAGQPVSFAVSAGGGSVTPESATTGDDGTATAQWTLGLTRIAQQLGVAATDPSTGEALSLTVSAQSTGPLVVDSLADLATPAPGATTLRLALATAASGEKITFDAALDGETILLDTVGDEHSVLKGEVYVAGAFAGYQERDYGRSALYARKNVVIDASALPSGITLRWNGGDASHARVLAVYGNLTMNGVTIASGHSAAEPLVGNTAQPFTLARGGGLAVWGVATLDRCTIAGNTVVGDTQASRDRGTYGGGIYANGLVMRDVVVSGNAATGYGAAGGGIYSVGGADHTSGRGNDTYLERCTVSGNRVRAQHAYGGGVFTLSGGPTNLATMEIANSTVARNLVEDNPALADEGQYYYRGGGVYMGGGSLSVIASTIAENAVNGPAAVFGGKPNVGGGGVAATVGNAHTVEYAWLQNSIVVGNTLNGAAEDWFPGSILDFRSCGYNVVGTLDFSQILVPVPAWMNLNRRRWPKTGDLEGVPLGDAVDVAGAQLHPWIVSAGTDAGSAALLWYPPGQAAADRVPDAAYALSYVNAGYTGYGVATDDFLNQVILQLRSAYPDQLGSDFGSALGDLTGTTWYESPVTWPSDPLNAAWIKFWRDLDVAIAGRLGMGGLGDAFWGTFSTGPVGNELITVTRAVQSFVHEPLDQRGVARPVNELADAGAIEK